MGVCWRGEPQSKGRAGDRGRGRVWEDEAASAAAPVISRCEKTKSHTFINNNSVNTLKTYRKRRTSHWYKF